MTNSIILIGRVVKLPELIELENGSKVTNLTLAITRSYKNQDGNYDTDFIDCTLWNGIAKSACEYCKKGDIIAVKGRIQSSILEKENMPKINMIQVIAERISFISSIKKTDNDIKEEV